VVERTSGAAEQTTREGEVGGLLWLAESPYLSGILFTGLLTIAANCALGDVD
jgi:hypothetical protein